MNNTVERQKAFAMISHKKAANIERAYRTLLYRRPIGIFSVLMLAGVSVFAIGLVASAAKVRIPFHFVYLSIFSALIVAISVHWLVQALALLTKRDWSGVVLAGIGCGAASFGSWLFITAIVRFAE